MWKKVFSINLFIGTFTFQQVDDAIISMCLC